MRVLTRRPGNIVRCLLALSLALVGIVGISGAAYADETPLLSGSAWLGGNGVNVCPPGTDKTCGGETHVGGISTNYWQCVELAQRLYKAEGWSSGVFPGVGVATDIYNTAAAPGNTNGFSRQANGSITSIVPGDMLVFSGGVGGTGHVGVVNTITGNNNGTDTVSVVNQNAYQVSSNVTWTLSTGTVSLYSYMDGSAPDTTFAVLGIVHAAGNTNSGGSGGSGSSNAYRAAFQTNTGNLYTFDSSSGTSATTQGLSSDTSPAITKVSSGYEEAFRAANGDLFVYGSNSSGDTLQGMQRGTSPSIAALPTSANFEVAFQANNGDLYIYSSATGSAINTGLGMADWSSPSIAALSGGGYQTAFQAAGSGDLYVYGTEGTYNTQQGMMAGMSPSIAAASSNNNFRVAFDVVGSGDLYTFDSVTGTSATNLGLASGTSPAIAALSIGGYEVVFQAAGTNYLYVDGPNGAANTQQGMMPYTNPSIIGLSGGTFEAAFQANNGYLFLYSSAAGGAVNTLQGMLNGTSPGIG